MMLSDTTIREHLADGRIRLDPPPLDAMIQPASVDLRLGREFIRVDKFSRHLSLAAPSERVLSEDRPAVSWCLGKGDCALGVTMERLTLPDNIVARVEGKSSWGRQFLMVHATAGFIDPGFSGQITLELHNLSPRHLMLPVYQPIAQISFQFLDRPAARPYGSPGLGSRYQGQTGVTEARA